MTTMTLAQVQEQMAQMAQVFANMQAIAASLEVETPPVLEVVDNRKVEPATADDPSTWTLERLMATVSKAGGPKWEPAQSLEKIAYAQGWNYHWLLKPIRGKNIAQAQDMRKTFGLQHDNLAKAVYAVGTGKYALEVALEVAPKADKPKAARETRMARTERLHNDMPNWADGVRKAYADGGLEGLNEYRKGIKYETCGCGTRTDKVAYSCKYAQTLENPTKVW